MAELVACLPMIQYAGDSNLGSEDVLFKKNCFCLRPNLNLISSNSVSFNLTQNNSPLFELAFKFAGNYLKLDHIVINYLTCEILQ